MSDFRSCYPVVNYGLLSWLQYATGFLCKDSRAATIYAPSSLTFLFAFKREILFRTQGANCLRMKLDYSPKKEATWLVQNGCSISVVSSYMHYHICIADHIESKKTRDSFPPLNKKIQRQK